jgi:GT2 family glycosyltransferase
MKLSIIIPAYNCLPQVLRLVNALMATVDPERTEVLIQDDCSPDYNAEQLFPPGMAQRNAINLGFGGNCNAGAERAKGDVLLFLNQDVYTAQQGWDGLLLKRFEETPEVGIVGPTLIFPNGHVQSVGGAFDAACQPYHIALGYANPAWPPIATARPVGWVTGAALAIRREVWQKLGGFDLAYSPSYFEDVDLCGRAALNGWQVWHDPAVTFTHEVGSTGGSAQFMKSALMFKRRWVDSGLIRPDCTTLQVRFWA